MRAFCNQKKIKLEKPGRHKTKGNRKIEHRIEKENLRFEET